MQVFDSAKFPQLALPKFKIYPNQMVRLETTEPEYCRELFDKISKNFDDKTVVNPKLKTKWFLRSPTVERFLVNESKMTSEDVQLFCEQASIKSNWRLKTLTQGEISLIHLTTFSNTKGFVLITTIGMYIECLRKSNQILRKILDQGGSCLEITYPPYNGDSPDNVGSSRITVFKI